MSVPIPRQDTTPTTCETPVAVRGGGAYGRPVTNHAHVQTTTPERSGVLV
ncbi:hypothetical protein DVS28_a3007 [Euzebya pacifica]|uniref:Uncharacterized protein n=1 Tax=Euzebya pacifica TaxID=1608957 RepID=A0A346XZN9_9ACTN|nr:hypothetical protein DVS28_a3007 [Euzebya pacifica]